MVAGNQLHKFVLMPVIPIVVFDRMFSNIWNALRLIFMYYADSAAVSRRALIGNFGIEEIDSAGGFNPGSLIGHLCEQ